MKKEGAMDVDINVYKFSHSKLDIFVGKYLNGIVISGWIVVLILEAFWGTINFSIFKIRYPTISINFLFPLFAILGLLFYLSLCKLAYRVIFDFDNETITFFLYKKKDHIVFNIDELRIIKINWYTFFIFNNGRTIWYKSDSTFIKFLKKFDINREWGSVGKHLMKKEFEMDTLGK